MLDELELERTKFIKRAKKTLVEVKQGYRHLYSSISNFLMIISDVALPPIADALVTSIITIVETYLHASAVLATNPATAYLSIMLAATAVTLHMTATTIASVGMSQASSKVASARNLFEQLGGFF
jgi:hypothetical protein